MKGEVVIMYGALERFKQNEECMRKNSGWRERKRRTKGRERGEKK